MPRSFVSLLNTGEELVYTEVQIAMGCEFSNRLSIELAVTARL